MENIDFEEPMSAYSFAENYLAGKTSDIDDREACEPLYFAAESGYEPAQEWLQQRAEGGLANAQFFLGLLMAQGLGAYEQDVEAGLSWLHKAADQDFCFALNSLALIYKSDVLVPQDLPKCVSLLQRAVELGDKDALDTLGTMYADGDGVPQDYARAVQLYELSALQGEVCAMVSLAFHYHRGLGTAKDLSKAEYWYRLACSKGNVEGLLGLAMVFDENGEYEDAAEAYMKALGNGEDIAFFDDDTPEFWLESVDVKSGPDFMSWSVKLHSDDEDEDPEKPEIRTYAQLLAAATDGNALAQHDVGFHYYWGGEDYEQDTEQAIRWFELAANNGHAQSAYNMGVLYAAEDEAVTQDFELACKWFRKAVELTYENLSFN